MPLAPKLAAHLAVAAAVASLSVGLAPAYADPIDPPVLIGDREGVDRVIKPVLSTVFACHGATVDVPVIEWGEDDDLSVEYCL